jgi:hypothetical protein
MLSSVGSYCVDMRQTAVSLRAVQRIVPSDAVRMRCTESGWMGNGPEPSGSAHDRRRWLGASDENADCRAGEQADNDEEWDEGPASASRDPGVGPVVQDGGVWHELRLCNLGFGRSRSRSHISFDQATKGILCRRDPRWSLRAPERNSFQLCPGGLPVLVRRGHARNFTAGRGRGGRGERDIWGCYSPVWEIGQGITCDCGQFRPIVVLCAPR